MHVVHHTDLIYEYKNVLDDEACDSLRQRLFDKASQCDVGADRNLIRNNSAVSITELPEFREIDLEVNGVIGQVHQLYATTNPTVLEYATKQGVMSSLRSTYSFRYYNADDSYEWHCDWNAGIWSVLSYVLYLDCDCVGGDLLFSRQRLRVKPEKGSVLAFPADLGHVHKSAKLRSGTKSIVYGNFFKQLK